MLARPLTRAAKSLQFLLTLLIVLGLVIPGRAQEEVTDWSPTAATLTAQESKITGLSNPLPPFKIFEPATSQMLIHPPEASKFTYGSNRFGVAGGSIFSASGRWDSVTANLKSYFQVSLIDQRFDVASWQITGTANKTTTSSLKSVVTVLGRDIYTKTASGTGQLQLKESPKVPVPLFERKFPWTAGPAKIEAEVSVQGEVGLDYTVSSVSWNPTVQMAATPYVALNASGEASTSFLGASVGIRIEFAPFVKVGLGHRLAADTLGNKLRLRSVLAANMQLLVGKAYIKVSLPIPFLKDKKLKIWENDGYVKNWAIFDDLQTAPLLSLAPTPTPRPTALPTATPRPTATPTPVPVAEVPQVVAVQNSPSVEAGNALRVPLIIQHTSALNGNIRYIEVVIGGTRGGIGGLHLLYTVSSANMNQGTFSILENGAWQPGKAWSTKRLLFTADGTLNIANSTYERLSATQSRLTLEVRLTNPGASQMIETAVTPISGAGAWWQVRGQVNVTPSPTNKMLGMVGPEGLHALSKSIFILTPVCYSPNGFDNVQHIVWQSTSSPGEALYHCSPFRSGGSPTGAFYLMSQGLWIGEFIPGQPKVPVSNGLGAELHSGVQLVSKGNVIAASFPVVLWNPGLYTFTGVPVSVQPGGTPDWSTIGQVIIDPPAGDPPPVSRAPQNPSGGTS